MKYCKRCVMPDRRYDLEMDEEGICSGCRNHENKQKVDWKKRWKQLEQLADKYRDDNYYDCIIAVSAGKDSYYQTHIFKEKLDMNPLLVMVNNFSWTETGKQNWENMLDTFNVDSIKYSLGKDNCKKMFRLALTKPDVIGTTWYFDRAIYTVPLQIAYQLDIPLVVYGENIRYEYGFGGFDEPDTYDAMPQIKNDAANHVPFEKWKLKDKRIYSPLRCPSIQEMIDCNINPVYLSYYVNWSGYQCMTFAKSRGFKSLEDTNEWYRQGFIEQYDQMDTIGYLIHHWMKFIRDGHFRVTDLCSLWIREGRMTRREAVQHVLDEDWRLDRKMLNDYLDFVGLKEEQFWKLIEPQINKDILQKINGNWRLKPNVIKALVQGGEIEIKQ